MSACPQCGSSAYGDMLGCFDCGYGQQPVEGGYGDNEEVTRAREEAINRADLPPSEEWKRHADEIIDLTAEAYVELTSEEVWGMGLRRPDNGSPDGDALGPAMRRAQKRGVIEFTGRVTSKTNRPQRHNNPKRIWRSLIYKPPES